jgi:hypothetical protein
VEGQLRRKDHSDERESKWVKLWQNENGTFKHDDKESSISPDAYSQTEMSGKDNQIRKYGIMSFIFKSQAPSRQLSSICTFAHSTSGRQVIITPARWVFIAPHI